MKVNNKQLLLRLLITIIPFLSSCSQNVLDVGDRYQIVFWIDFENAELIRQDGGDSLRFYINNNLVATCSSGEDWSTAPSCEDSTAITAQIDLLPRHRSVFYKVTDQTGFEYFNGTYTLATNTCNAIQIGPITKFK